MTRPQGRTWKIARKEEPTLPGGKVGSGEKQELSLGGV
jgi:hypothetical protein